MMENRSANLINNPNKDNTGRESNKSGHTRREFLKGAAGVVAKTALTAGPLASVYNNSKHYEKLEGDLRSFEARVDYHIKRFTTNLEDYKTLRDNALVQMPDIEAGGMTRAEFVRVFFEGGSISSYNLPSNVIKGLAYMAPGIVAQESKFDLEATNPRTKAYGPWQATQRYVDDFNQRVAPRRKTKGAIIDDTDPVKGKITIEQMNDLVLATKVAFMSFEVAYESLRGDIAGIARIFHIKGFEADKLATLILVNAHNAGATRMRGVIKEFINQYKDDNKNVHIGIYNAQKLFHSMSVLMRGKVEGYRQESSAYVAACMAGAEVVNAMIQDNSGIYTDTEIAER